MDPFAAPVMDRHWPSSPQRAGASVKDVEKVPFLLLVTDDYPDVISDYWQSRGCHPDIHFRTNSFEAIRSLVAQERGDDFIRSGLSPVALGGQRVIRRTIDDCITIWMWASSKRRAAAFAGLFAVDGFLRQQTARRAKRAELRP